MVGMMKQIMLQEWGQSKSGTGSTVDSLISSYPIYAEVKRSGGSRSYEQNQLKLSDTMRMKIRWRDSFDIDALWKVVYQGRRHTVVSVEKVDERNFDYQLTVESKGTPIG